jgi:MerR family mercuric resistance operon transcriptional regulator
MERSKTVRGAMTIGALAKAAGVNVETIRYYQRRGLLDEPAKPPGGQRRYADAVVGRMGFIRRAQQLGFSLEEVKSLLELSHGKRPLETRAMCERKHAELSRRVGQLNHMRRKLKALIGKSLRSKLDAPCPIIGALSTPD